VGKLLIDRAGLDGFRSKERRGSVAEDRLDASAAIRRYSFE
jgi:hypothetical protein